MTRIQMIQNTALLPQQKKTLKLLAESFYSCDEFLKEIDLCDTFDDVRELMKTWNESIAEKLGLDLEPETITETEYIKYDDIYDYMERECEYLSVGDLIKHSIGHIDWSIRDDMKLETIMESWSDITLEDIDALIKSKQMRAA